MYSDLFSHIRADEMLPEAAEEKDARFQSKPHSISNKADWYSSSGESDGDDTAPYHDLAFHHSIAGTYC